MRVLSSQKISCLPHHVDSVMFCYRGMVRRLGRSTQTSGDGGSEDVTAAVAAVLEEVEEYLVCNLVELERAGANGTENKTLPDFFNSFMWDSFSQHTCSQCGHMRQTPA